MNVIYLMIFFTMLIVAGFLAAFIWASRRRQFEDLVTPAYRILNDDQQKQNDNREGRE